MTSSPNLDEAEEKVRSELLERESKVLGVIEDLINQQLAGFDKIGSFTITEDNDLQRVWFLLTARAFNSLRWAYHLIQMGYYSQSMMLVRGAFEDWLVCEDAKLHPQTISALLEQKGRLPSFSDMANRLEEPLKTEWHGGDGADGPYGLLSTFTHPRYHAVASLFPPGGTTIRLGPSWDEDLFIVTANYLIMALTRMMEFFVALVPSDTPWLDSAVPYMVNANHCRDELAARAKARLEAYQ